MNKELRKTITVQTHLNKFEKRNCSENHSAHKMQYNFYNNLNVKKIRDDTCFWKTIKPNFSEKNHKR